MNKSRDQSPKSPKKQVPNIVFELASEFITLDSLLKAVGIAPSGGAAKAMVAGGEVQVNGATELRKTCKIRAGQMVAVRAHAGAVEVRAGDFCTGDLQ